MLPTEALNYLANAINNSKFTLTPVEYGQFMKQTQEAINALQVAITEAAKPEES